MEHNHPRVLADLPEDTIREIMFYLDPKSLKRLEITCRRYNLIGNNSPLWRYWALQKWLATPDDYKGPKDFTKYQSDGVDWQEYYTLQSLKDYEKRKQLPTRLFVFRAKNSPIAVILRRGPRKQWLMIRWNTEKDTFEYGQWFKGFIHTPFCHLSDDGVHFIYFASKYGQQHNNNHQIGPHWTAISKVPYFTAVALWSNDSVHEGGGRFAAKSELRLFRPTKDAVISPKNLRIYCNNSKMPAKYLKAHLDGVPQPTINGHQSPVLNPTPLLYEKGVQWDECRDTRTCPCSAYMECCRIEYAKPHLRMVCKWTSTEPIGGSLVMLYRRTHSYFVEGQTEELVADWADVDVAQKRLLYSIEGRLYAKPFTLTKDKHITWGQEKLLEDFTTRQFEFVAPPNWAKEW